MINFSIQNEEASEYDLEYFERNYFSNENFFLFWSKSNEINLNNNLLIEDEKEERNIKNDIEHYFTYPSLPSHLKECICDKKEKKKEKIFLIVKNRKLDLINSSNHKKGRRKIKNVLRDDIIEKVGYHSKFKEDNVIQKLKVFFIKSSMKLINKRYQNFLIKKGKRKTIFLMKIKSIYAQTIKKEKNIEFLQIKIKDLFASELSEKCIKVNKDYNKNQINKIYEKNEAKEVIEILDKKVEELLNNYINGDYKDEGFFIEYDLKKIEQIDDINESNYAKKFIETAKNITHIFYNKKSRRKIVKKMI